MSGVPFQKLACQEVSEMQFTFPSNLFLTASDINLLKPCIFCSLQIKKKKVYIGVLKGYFFFLQILFCAIAQNYEVIQLFSFVFRFYEFKKMYMTCKHQFQITYKHIKQQRLQWKRKNKREKMWSSNICVIFLFCLSTPFYKFNFLITSSLNWNLISKTQICFGCDPNIYYLVNQTPSRGLS